MPKSPSFIFRCRQAIPAFLILLPALCGCDDASSTGGMYAQERMDCVDTMNEYRATLDLPPLARWSSGEACADGEAESDSQTGIAHSAFGTCGESAQNECPGWGSVDQIATGCLSMMWAEGPGEPYSEHGHYINMSSTSYTMVACGYYVTDDGSVWALQNFK